MTATLSLAQMVDLALGTPELGAVNFNVLHTLLHAVLKKLDLTDIKADIRDEDRDFLSNKQLDSARDGDSVITDGSDSAIGSAKSTAGNIPRSRPHYHQLQDKVLKIEQQLEALNALPSNSDLFERAKAKAEGDGTQRPVTEMWQYMQLAKKVDANEEGVSKLMSLVGDLMAEMQQLKDLNDKLQKQLNELNSLKDLVNRFNDLEKMMNDMNEKMSLLPSPDWFNDYVTWASLENALKGMKEELTPPPVPDRIVIEMSSQTDPASRPASAVKPPTRPPSSRASTPGPSVELAEILEKIGKLTNRHDALEVRVDNLEEQMKNKVDKDDLQNALAGLDIGVPGDLLDKLNKLQEEIESLKKNRDKDLTDNRLNESSSGHTSTDKEFKDFNITEKTPGNLSTERPKSGSKLFPKIGPESVGSDPQHPTQHNGLSQVGNSTKRPKSGSKPFPKIVSESVGSDPYHPTQKNGLSQVGNASKSSTPKINESLQQSSERGRKDARPSGDSEMLSRLQQALQNLQAELERLSKTTQSIIEDNKKKQSQIDSLCEVTTKLDEVKADKDFVQMEVDVKADKRHLDGKVNRSLFDQTCDELSKLINDILNKLSGHEDEWKKALGGLANDLDGKLDRLEFGPIRDDLEKQLRALRGRLNQLNWHEGDDDAAGIRKQLLRFHCISCDRPVDMMQQGPVASIPAQNGLPGTRSARPYTTFELDQIRQHAKKLTIGKNMSNFDRALLERQLARCRRQNDIRAFLIHFGKELGFKQFTHYKDSTQMPTNVMKGHLDLNSAPNMEQVMDLYATQRACGGNHTLTYPNRRITRLTHINNLFREETLADPATPAPVPLPTYREEMDIQGADGHIYKGRFETRLPTVQGVKGGTTIQKSPQPPRKTPPGATPRPVSSRGGMRPASARVVSPRPASGGRLTSRPQSAAPSQITRTESQLDNAPGPPEPSPAPAMSTSDNMEPPPPRTPTPTNINEETPGNNEA